MNDHYSLSEILIRDIQEEDDLSSVPSLMVAAFGDGMDLGWATTIVSNLRKDGIVAIDKESSEIVGCNFLSPSADESRGIGPIAVKQGSLRGLGLGKKLMEKIIEKAKQEGTKRITLIQEAHNTLTLALYSKLGFRVKNHFAEFTGPCKSSAPSDPRYTIRPLGPSDATAASDLWLAACGYSMRDAIMRHTQRRYTLQAPYSARPFAVLLEGEKLVGFTLGLNITTVALKKDIEAFQALCRQRCDPENREDVLTLLVSLEDNCELVEWLLAEKLMLTGTHNLMVYRDHFYTRPRDGWLFLPSMAGC